MTQLVPDSLVDDVRRLIDSARSRVAVTVNAELTLLYWQIGRRISEGVLGGARADYGQRVLEGLARQLTAAYGRGWSEKQLRHCMRAAEVFPDEEILSALRRELSWTLTPEVVLKDPYVLDFLGLNDRYLERDLEDAILREMEQFLLELGAGFSFVARQKRLQIDDDDFYLDLLFYNRKLRRLVAVELKLGAFKADYKSQMELYLRWLAKHEQEPGEQPPIGIILCAGKKQEQIELLELGNSGIHVAEYLMVLPPRETLEAKLHQSIAAARSRLRDAP
jgi:predicted nuclease of restriction endonuclease-like (RecB) superfamily